MKVIYIMGPGHVGSTVLDVTLGAHSNVESLGEVSKFLRSGWTPDNNRKCACGCSVYECPFWLEVRKKWSDLTGDANAIRYISLQKLYESSSPGWPRLLWDAYRLSPSFTEFMRGTEALYSAIHQVGSKPILVDSSLTPRRAYALSRNPNIDLHLIHMVRDGRGIIWSLMKPGKQILTKEYIPAPPFRTTRYWISANLQSLWVFNQVKEEKRQLIRYEDFVTNPPMTLKKIGDWIGEDFTGLVSDFQITDQAPVRHTVGGNRIRMQKGIRIKPDFAWLEKLPARDRRMFWQTAGWLARRFGYIQHQIDYQ
jgi:hypothetical protein